MDKGTDVFGACVHKIMTNGEATAREGSYSDVEKRDVSPEMPANARGQLNRFHYFGHPVRIVSLSKQFKKQSFHSRSHIRWSSYS